MIDIGRLQSTCDGDDDSSVSDFDDEEEPQGLDSGTKRSSILRTDASKDRKMITSGQLRSKSHFMKLSKLG